MSVDLSVIGAELAGLLSVLQGARGAARAVAARALLERSVHGAATARAAVLPELLALAADRQPDVRKSLAAAIQDLCGVAPELVGQSLAALCLLVQDSAAAVQKRAIQAASIAYRTAAKQPSATVPQDTLAALKLLVLNLIDSENEGVRTHSIKFLEEVVSAQAGAPGGAGDEAEHIFELLLKFQSSGHVSSVSLMACMTSLVNLARARPQWAARVQAALQALQAAVPPGLSQGQATSVRKHARALAARLKPVADKRRKERPERPERPDKRPRLREPQPEPAPQPPSEDALAGALSDVPRVVTLVLDTLRRLPAAMPPDFAVQYRPQPAAPLPLQRVRLARLLLAAARGEMPAPPPVPPAAPAVPAPVPAAPAPVVLPGLSEDALPAPVPPPLMQDDDDDDDDFESEDQDKTVANKENGKPSNVPFLKEEDEKAALKSAVLKLQSAGQVQTGQSAQMEEVERGWERGLRLAEVTSPLGEGARARLVAEAAARAAGAGGVAARGKVAALLGAAVGGTRAAVRGALLAEGAPRLPELLSWLYHEYCIAAGFARLPVTLAARPEQPQRQYGELLAAAADRLADSPAALRRLLLEAPRITAPVADVAPIEVLEELASRGSVRGLRALAARAPELAARGTWRGHARAELMREAAKRAAQGDLELALALAGQAPDMLLLAAKHYAEVDAADRKTLLVHIEPRIKEAAESEDPEMVEMLSRECPAGAEPLLARILHLKADRGSVSANILTEVRSLYARCGDVRLLLPLLPMLHRSEIVACLPGVVRLGGAGLRDNLLRLLEPPAIMTPTELVEELHLVEVGQAELKQLIRATALCFSEPQHFPPNQVLEGLISLCEKAASGGQVPVLVARSLLQALALGGVGAAGGVARALAALASARCWRRRVVHEGWLKCAQRLIALGAPGVAELLRAVPQEHLTPDLIQIRDAT